MRSVGSVCNARSVGSVVGSVRSVVGSVRSVNAPSALFLKRVISGDSRATLGQLLGDF